MSIQDFIKCQWNLKCNKMILLSNIILDELKCYDVSSKPITWLIIELRDFFNQKETLRLILQRMIRCIVVWNPWFIMVSASCYYLNATSFVGAILGPRHDLIFLFLRCIFFFAFFSSLLLFFSRHSEHIVLIP